MSDPDQQAITDQSDDVRDPADDSDEMNSPATMADTYPDAFDDKIAAAEQAIDEHDLNDDTRTVAGNGSSREDEAKAINNWHDNRSTS
ncbi:hypothetical protein [Nakamurella leprariae]|uniref:Uncharacterized protein n=1 Tax=Nakamurella leprariae TaxID=2803911 RepID=A0A938YF16_9ACTN|nr:hypothetical protein [Nakamurella leprariae]MBM9468664.1 hypothetical protein [Nakamurella leprariae]